jgi:hypothetical protein
MSVNFRQITQRRIRNIRNYRCDNLVSQIENFSSTEYAPDGISTVSVTNVQLEQID